MTEATHLASLGCQHNRFGHILSRGGRLGGQEPGQTRRGLGPVWTPTEGFTIGSNGLGKSALKPQNASEIVRGFW